MLHHNHWREDDVHVQAHLTLHENDACNDASPQPFEAYIFLLNNHKSNVKYSFQ